MNYIQPCLQGLLAGHTPLVDACGGNHRGQQGVIPYLVPVCVLYQAEGAIQPLDCLFVLLAPGFITGQGIIVFISEFICSFLQLFEKSTKRQPWVVWPISCWGFQYMVVPKPLKNTPKDTYTYTNTGTHSDAHRDKHTDTHTDTHRQRHRHTDTEAHIDTHIQTQKNKQTHRQTNTQTHTDTTDT